ncbi:MAG TPA: helix-turn-helix domain-containing protein [Bacillales bacterium]|nr:helix-turn-helix domain-containing protein [Bacillales bacterium]
MDERLSDAERKIFRMLCNLSRLGKNPTIERICLWSGRSRDNVRLALNGLVEKKYIKWPSGNQIRLLRRKEMSKSEREFEKLFGNPPDRC